MKRCYFLGLNDIFDNGFMDCLYAECERVIAKEKEVEFWFLHGDGLSFGGSCLSLATLLKSAHPEKDIKIVRVYDPTNGRRSSDWYKEAYHKTFPLCVSDRHVYAPLMDEGFAKIQNQFVQQAHKIERWVLRQMDVVFAYYYPNYVDSVNHQIEYAHNSCNAEVVHIRFDDTEKLIQEKVNTLFDERTTTILTMQREHISNREIGKAVGVSSSRVGQIAHKAMHEIRRELMKRGMREKHAEIRKCGLLNLSDNATSFQLVVFKSLLEYLSDRYFVKEFWIDEKSCNTPYGAILAMFCASGSPVRSDAKVVLHIGEDETGRWEKSIAEYVPPYSSVVDIGIDSPEQSSFYGEIIRQCDFIIANLDNPESNVIRELCASAGNYLFNTPREEFAIEAQYINEK